MFLIGFHGETYYFKGCFYTFVRSRVVISNLKINEKGDTGIFVDTAGNGIDGC